MDPHNVGGGQGAMPVPYFSDSESEEEEEEEYYGQPPAWKMQDSQLDEQFTRMCSFLDRPACQRFKPVLEKIMAISLVYLPDLRETKSSILYLLNNIKTVQWTTFEIPLIRYFNPISTEELESLVGNANFVTRDFSCALTDSGKKIYPAVWFPKGGAYDLTYHCTFKCNRLFSHEKYFHLKIACSIYERA
jgi:hypothetical protein